MKITMINGTSFLKGVVSFNNAGGRAGSQVVLQQYRQQYSTETIERLVIIQSMLYMYFLCRYHEENGGGYIE